MIVVRLKGGLGNQMFQYAFARALAARFNTGVCFDVTGLQDEAPIRPHTPRRYALGSFRIAQRFAAEKDISLFASRGWSRLFRPSLVLREPALAYTPEAARRARRRTLLEGYWQSEKYFTGIQNILREEFRLAQPLSKKAGGTAALLRERRAVSLHVRRGDFAGNPDTRAYHGECGMEYYEKAADTLAKTAEKPLFAVFSDDPGWCRRHIQTAGETLFLDPSPSPAEDMHLMSQCAHHIIANSTFGWWGAWLNPCVSKIVIAPKPWLASGIKDQPDIVPREWIEIEK